METKMSEHLGFSVDIEGAEETITLMNTMVTQINTVITLVDRAGEATELFKEVKTASDETLKEVIATAEETTEKLKGVKESLATSDIKDYTRDASMLLGTLASVDYVWMSWSRAATKFDIRTFISTLLSTISFIRRLTTLIELATAKQQALNAAQAAGAVSGAGAATGGLAGLTTLLGPIGIIATLALATYSIVNTIMEQNAKIAEEMRKDREDRERREKVFEKVFGERASDERVFGEKESNEEYERKRREAYRSVVPG